MASVMKAFVMRRAGEVAMVEKPIPDPGPNDAVVKTTAALVCTSDCHTVGGAIGERANLPLGHEAVGVIAKLGSEVKGFREGDREAVNAITPCYHCDNCLPGRPTPLTTHRFPFAHAGGAFHTMQSKADGILKPLIQFV